MRLLMFKRIAWFFLFAATPVLTHAQTAVLPIYACTLPGTQAQVSGLKSSNYQMGVIPSCTVTVYLTGTQTLATTTPQSPFTANTNGSIPPIYAPLSQAYDVVLSGGYPPNAYTAPVTLTDVTPGIAGFGCISGNTIANGCTGATTVQGAATNIVNGNSIAPSSLQTSSLGNGAISGPPLASITGLWATLPLTGWTGGLTSFGDSRTQDSTYPDQQYPYLLWQTVGGLGSRVNYADSGKGVADQTNAVFNNVFPGAAGVLYTWNPGVNDVNFSGPGAFENTFNSVYGAGILGLDFSIGWITMPSAPSNWTVDTTFSRITGLETTSGAAAPLVISYTTTAEMQQPVLLYECINGDSGTFTLSDSANPYPYQYTTAPPTPFSASDGPTYSVCSDELGQTNSRGLVLSRPPGTYTLTITPTVNSGSVHILGVGVTPAAITSGGGFVLAFDIYRQRGGLNGAPIEQYNNDIHNDCAFLNGMNVNVGCALTDNFVTGSALASLQEFWNNDGGALPSWCDNVSTGWYIHGCNGIQAEMVEAADAPFYRPNSKPSSNVYADLVEDNITVNKSFTTNSSSTTNFYGGVGFNGNTNLSSASTLYMPLTHYAGGSTSIALTEPSVSGTYALVTQLPGAAQLNSGNNIALAGTPKCSTSSPISYTPAAAGNTLVIAYFNDSGTPITSITDQASNPIPLIATSANYAAIYGVSGGSITAIDWSASVNALVCINEYSGALAFGKTSAGSQGATYSISTYQSPNSYTIAALNQLNTSTAFVASSGTILIQSAYNTGGGNRGALQDIYSAGNTALISGTAGAGATLYVTVEVESSPSLVGISLAVGSNTVYRCLTAGAVLPAGSLTITAAACGSSTATGLTVE
jgi:hypothetical protein